jgi:hypothetical protein
MLSNGFLSWLLFDELNLNWTAVISLRVMHQLQIWKLWQAKSFFLIVQTESDCRDSYRHSYD